MIGSGSSKDVRVFTEQEEVSLEKASFNAGLAIIDFDEEKKEFFASLDKVVFDGPIKIIKQVLQVNGYVANLENMIATVDSMKLAVRAKGQAAEVEDGVFKAKSFCYGVHFKLPNKQSKGDLLEAFYNEIQGYEAELARLQEYEKKDETNANKSEDQLREENRKLRQMNDRLAAKIDELTRVVLNVKQQQAESSRAFEKADKLPKDVRAASVRDVSISDRSVTLKTETQTYTVSLLIANTIPNPRDPALIYVVDGKVKSVYFYASMRRTYDTETAEVLYKDLSSLKIRRSNRNEIVIKAKTEEEKELIASLDRKEKILLYMLDGQLVFFQKLNDPKPEFFEDLFSDTLVREQIGEITYEKFIGEIDNEQDDVA